MTGRRGVLQVLWADDIVALALRSRFPDSDVSNPRQGEELAMGFFWRKRFVWNEPWFFLQRLPTTKGWVILVADGPVHRTTDCKTRTDVC